MQSIVRALLVPAILVSLLLVAVLTGNTPLLAAAHAGSTTLIREITPADAERVRRNYRHTSRYLHSSYGIVIDGTPSQIRRISRWLDQIYTLPVGGETIDALIQSRNRITVRHSPWALRAAGRTSAPLSRHLTDGIGEDVLLLFDSRVPESGSHWVFDKRRQPIEFNVLHNLFHELVHARHLSGGTWRYFDSEGQAIEEENVFRAQLAERDGIGHHALRVGIRGKQFWWSDANSAPEARNLSD